MTWTLHCDACPATASPDDLRMPEGWTSYLDPATGYGARKHRCPECSGNRKRGKK